MISRNQLRSSESPGKYSIQSRNRRRRGYSQHPTQHRAQSKPSSSATSCSRRQPHHPSRNDGQRNEPCSRRLVARTRPRAVPEQQLHPVGPLGSEIHRSRRRTGSRPASREPPPRARPSPCGNRLGFIAIRTFTPEEGTIMPLPSARERSSPASRRRRSTERARPSRRRGFPRPLRPAQPSQPAPPTSPAQSRARPTSPSRGL